VLRAAATSVMTDTVNMLDTITVTGPGTWTNLTAKAVKTMSGNYIYPQANVIRDTHVRGLVDLGPNATGTTIENVNFSVGPARVIVQVNGSSSVTISRICAPPGSSIAGTGTVIYQGQRVTLPYKLGSANACQSTTPAGMY
jgi:hypothetical protein